MGGCVKVTDRVDSERDQIGVRTIMHLGMVRTPNNAISAEEVEQPGDHRARGDRGSVEDSGADLDDQVLVLGKIDESLIVFPDRYETAVVDCYLAIGYSRGETGYRL